jgi:two-component system, NtrC family, sensor kinase
MKKAFLGLPITVKILFPFISVLLGVWTIGSFSFFKDYLAKDLKLETENLSVLVFQDLQHKQELLRSQAQWIADKNDLSNAIASGNQTLLLQTLLPIQAALKLELIKIITVDGKVLVDLRQGEITQAKLDDTSASKAAKIGLEISDVISAENAPSLLAGIISIKSQEKVLGGVIAGSTITNESLKKIRGNAEFELVALQDSQIIASTLFSTKLFSKKTASWQAPPPNSPSQLIKIAGQGYIAKTIIVNGNDTTAVKIVLLKSTASLEATEQKLWLSITGFGLIGGASAILVGIWTTNWLTRRIQTLITATQTLANGDFNTRIPIQNQDEVSLLAQGFNFMAEQLTLRNEKISEQVQQLETTLQKLYSTQAQLIQSEKMSSLGQMVAGIAHEINNPTTFIHGNLTYAKEYTQEILNLLQLYQQHYPNPPQTLLTQVEQIELDFMTKDLEKIFNSMQNGCDRISDIVISLRNFSRLDESDFKRVNIHEGIDSTLMILTSRLKQQAKRPEIKVIKEYDNLPPIECYPGELNQVFMNILSNAIDTLDEKTQPEHTSYPNPIPQINIHTQQINEDWVAIHIQDNGMGMTEEVASKIFDPFFTTKPVGKGTGLGMTVCYQIIEKKHGGKINCNSIPGTSTEFIVQIPLKQPQK